MGGADVFFTFDAESQEFSEQDFLEGNLHFLQLFVRNAYGQTALYFQALGNLGNLGRTEEGECCQKQCRKGFGNTVRGSVSFLLCLGNQYLYRNFRKDRRL